MSAVHPLARYDAKGFTLIELLVALSILAILSVLGFRALDHLRLVHQRVSDTQSLWQALSRTSDRLGRDIRRAVPPGPWQEAGPASAIVFSLQQDPAHAELVFVRGNDEGKGWQRVSYLWQAEAGGSLWLGHTNMHGAPPGQAQPLLTPASGLEFAVLDTQGQWHGYWPTGVRPDLPRALRLRLRLPDGQLVERIFDVPAAQ